MAERIQEYSGRFDQYCPKCAQTATFSFQVDPEFSASQRRLAASATNIRSPNTGARLVHTNFSKHAVCTRNNHRAIYHFQAFDDGIMKIGQFPSVADILSGDIQKYKKVFDDSEMKGLKTAIGLHAHGVGAGAFIYLRKIFEAQVEQAHVIARNDKDWDDGAYTKLMRMSERIETLKLYLPEILVRNNTLYSILSEHLHLGPSEQECVDNFDVVLQGIFLIAEEKLEKLQRANQLADFNRSKQALLELRAAEAAARAAATGS
ncbi:hypothetical protein GTP45_00985 [Pseudoduganella sp. FT55W]|uniref:Uncharacterized protein n=1 Tax=Duganella rivi TaxID=2666083 RepID=A0A7X4K8V7_9BURK|nr:hypothetical protein [Duganella rivi]MYM65406.1 hypothetical protein [Duganella rivi]